MSLTYLTGKYNRQSTTKRQQFEVRLLGRYLCKVTKVPPHDGGAGGERNRSRDRCMCSPSSVGSAQSIVCYTYTVMSSAFTRILPLLIGLHVSTMIAARTSINNVYHQKR